MALGDYVLKIHSLDSYRPIEPGHTIDVWHDVSKICRPRRILLCNPSAFFIERIMQGNIVIAQYIPGISFEMIADLQTGVRENCCIAMKFGTMNVGERFALRVRNETTERLEFRGFVTMLEEF